MPHFIRDVAEQVMKGFDLLHIFSIRIWTDCYLNEFLLHIRIFNTGKRFAIQSSWLHTHRRH